jgi:hypothetical protein
MSVTEISVAEVPMGVAVTAMSVWPSQEEALPGLEPRNRRNSLPPPSNLRGSDCPLNLSREIWRAATAL